MSLELGRQGRLYTGLHTNYGDTPTPASADALRHTMVLFSHDGTNRRNSPEKRHSPFHFTRFDGRVQASLRQLTGLVRPSGTLNTLPESADIFEAAFGSVRNITLATTLNAGATTTGGTLASATGLAVHDHVLITCPDSIKRVRRLTAVNTGTGAVTWAPALPEAPATSAPVKAGITFAPTTGLAKALWMAHYLRKTDGSTAGMKRLLKGVGIDRFSLAIDATDEAQWTVSGPAQTLISGDSVPAQPGAFTVVGGNPPSGMQSELWIGGTRYRFLKASLELTNGLRVRNNEAGDGTQNMATEIYRATSADVAVGIDARVEDPSVLYTPSVAGTTVSVHLQQGFTEGNIWACSLPRVEFKQPDMDDPDEEANWPFKGMALASADQQNDPFFFAFF